MKEAINRVINEHWALVVTTGIVAIFVPIALLGPKPPPPKPDMVVVTLSKEDREFIHEAIRATKENREMRVSDGGLSLNHSNAK